MDKFRERLQKAADHAKVGDSQAEMASSLGLNRQTINRWVQGGTQPNAQMLLHVARAWGVSAEWLRTGEGEMVPTNDWSLDERELVKDFRLASPKVREVIKTMVRAARKSVVTLAAVIPPLLAPQNSDASILHNHLSAAKTPTEYVLHTIRKYLSALWRCALPIAATN